MTGTRVTISTHIFNGLLYLIANEIVELPPVCLTGKGNVYMNINITTVEYSMLRLYFKWITNKAGSNYVRYNSLGIVASALLVYIFDHLHLRYIRVCTCLEWVCLRVLAYSG